ncbi:TauD/TfdA dioxygenase family protein [Streptomyces sp. NPDC059352]|uniref:TauD/TfdA dioxygenase family protein n=1 Tax=Streptomyces sp. NPDC059352 TaxID=3346810 RepID=UPI003687DFE9
MVRVHPETGERTLLLGNFVQRISGLTGADSRAPLALFQSHVERPENTVRWQWQVGDVAIWDNRATQHYGVDDSDEHERKLRRVAIDGDVPVGVDGRSAWTAGRRGRPVGVDDSDEQERKLRRVTIDGDVPVGVDGRSSVLLAPESVPGPAFGIASGASTAEPATPAAV